jgi:hypothetical protein
MLPPNPNGQSQTAIAAINGQTALRHHRRRQVSNDCSELQTRLGDRPT